MIRVVLAVVLGSALFGAALPSAEHADRDRSLSLAIAELERLNEAAERLIGENDPVDPSNTPPSTTVTLHPPEPTFVEPGRFWIDHGEFRWVPSVGENRTVETTVPTRAETPTFVTERTRIRLSLVRLHGGGLVRMRVGRERV